VIGTIVLCSSQFTVDLFSEYVSERDKRRAFISNFSGSAGTAVVTANEALLWTDGRYFLQAEQELPEGWTLMKDGMPDVPRTDAWLVKNLPTGATIGLDAFVTSISRLKSLNELLKDNPSKKLVGLLAPVRLLNNWACQKLAWVTENPVDGAWKDQPPVPADKVMVLSQIYSGR